MRSRVIWLAFALTMTVGATVGAQPPGGPGGPGGRGGPGGGRGGPGGGPGPGGGLERIVDDLRLSDSKREVVLVAFRTYQDNVDRLTDMTGSGLLLKVKELVSAEEFKTLKEATDKARNSITGNRRLAIDDLVDHIMSFDKNKDGKITKEELPERMQYLVEKGDTNKDGSLDRDEIKKLAAEMAKEESSSVGQGGRGPGGRGGPCGGGPGGRGPGGPGNPANGGLTTAAIEKALGDLKLDDTKKASVSSAVQAHKDQARNLTTLASAEVMLQVSDLLTEAEQTKCKTALARLPGVGERAIARNGPPPGRGGPPRE